MKNATLLKYWDTREIFDRIKNHSEEDPLVICILCHEPSDTTAKRRWEDLDDLAVADSKLRTEYRNPTISQMYGLKGWPTVRVIDKSSDRCRGLVHFLWQPQRQQEMFKTADVLVIEGEIYQMYNAIRGLLYGMGLDQ